MPTHRYFCIVALSSRIIDRIFSGAVTRSKQDGKMSYTEFVAFLLSEEDKKTDKRYKVVKLSTFDSRNLVSLWAR